MIWILVVSIILTALLVLLIYWGMSCAGYPKLKFSSFKKFYALNPDRWDFYDDRIICKSDVDYGFGRRKDYFAFGFVDFYRYKLWYKKLEKDDKKKKDVESLAHMIAAVKKDIENTEVEAQRCYKKVADAIQDISGNKFDNTELMED